MNKNLIILCILSVGISFTRIQAQVTVKAAIIAFYNVENLFDTIDDPMTNDAEFLPTGANAWTGERYHQKLNNMAKVISQIGDEYIKGGPTILGVSEIENELVLRDLIANPHLSSSGYDIVHFNSPDRRGVDVGLLYRKASFKVLNATSTRLHVPSNPNFRTRDQLCVTGSLDGETISIIVNHWPARGNDEVYRLAAAALTKHLSDSLYTINTDAKIIIMGDLNDDPVDKSIVTVLGAKGKENKVGKGDLFNPMWSMFKNGIGSLAYKDSWNIFDQIIVSEPLIRNPPIGWHLHKTKVFNKPFLIATEGQYAGYPLRTFSNGAFINGYSDHFPVYITLIK